MRSLFAFAFFISLSSREEEEEEKREKVVERENERLRVVWIAGEDALRVGPGKLMLGLRREGSRRELPRGEAHSEPPLPRLPLTDAMEGLRSQAHPDGLRLRDLRRLPWPEVRARP